MEELEYIQCSMRDKVEEEDDEEEEDEEEDEEDLVGEEFV
jgi:hypothetical protein